MAAGDGRRDPPLAERLRREPYRFEVAQAVRILERMAGSPAPLGEGSDWGNEAVMLRGSLSFRFPPSQIEALRAGMIDSRPELTLTVLGLAGGFGPLPPPLCAEVLARARRRDLATRDFLDVFNHRLLSLLVRQARLFSPALQDHRARETAARRPLLAVLGLLTLPAEPDSATAAARLGGLEPSLLEAAGMLNMRPVSAHALQRLLAAHFGVPAGVCPLQGGWLALEEDEQTRLGRAGPRLGAGAVLGRRVWDQGAGILLHLGPMHWALFAAMLPGGAAHLALTRLVGLLLGGMLDVRVELRLRPEETPAARLGGGDAGRARLGWSAWLGSRPRAAPGTARLRLPVAGMRA